MRKHLARVKVGKSVNKVAIMGSSYVHGDIFFI